MFLEMSAAIVECLDESFFKVRFSKEKNRSFFTTKLIKKGSIVIEYVGEVITDVREMQNREISYANDNLGCFLLYISFQGKKAFIDATKETAFKARLINHSKKPNLEPFKIIIDEVPTVFFKAKKDIDRGTELLWNYGDRRKAIIKKYPWLRTTKSEGVSKEQTILLKDLYVKLDKSEITTSYCRRSNDSKSLKSENSWLNKTVNSFQSLELNSSKHSTPLQRSKEDVNMNVSKDQLIHLKDAYVKLDKLENNSINKTLNSFGSFQINSNKHSTPMKISKEDENINVSIEASKHLRESFVALERLSNTENESNCTSAARSGATEIMDLLGDSWLKNSLDSSNQLINPYSDTSTPRYEEFKDIQLRSHMILNQDCLAPMIEMKNRRSQETGTIIKTNLPKKIDYVNEKVSNEVTSIVSTEQNPSERQISVDLVPEEAVFTNDNNDFVLPQTCNLSSSDSKEIVNINEYEFIILEQKLTDIMIDDLEKGLNYIDVNNNNNNPECNSLNIDCNPIDSSKFTEFSTNSSTINENNINETYTITPKPQMPKIVEMVILQPGDPLYDIKNLGKKFTLLDA
ncbi:putative uncharacterized protein DDB_G0277255 [Leptopilina boulardi]|uniref:putative uncharacterized protein DDB_G0277255 n=1 Tax=Leptopilina boulardi TaxID=63433 RepID=UPI0021F665AF|nr:putative uncharacterized protein DDB_G0277255 [Leptopilina boulardi]